MNLVGEALFTRVTNGHYRDKRLGDVLLDCKPDCHGDARGHAYLRYAATRQRDPAMRAGARILLEICEPDDPLAPPDLADDLLGIAALIGRSRG